MSLLDKVQRGKRAAPRRILLYGTHGVGKSTFASCAPRPIFIQTEDGLGDIDCERFPLATSYQDVMDALEALYTGEHSYQTLVVDSLDWLERLIWNEVCKQRSVTNIEEIGYGKGYAFALTFWREFLTALDALRNDINMMIILIAHAKIERFENPETDGYDRYVPRVHKLASQLVQEWCDEVLFATYKVYTKQVDGKTRGVGTGERVMYTTEKPSHVAKNRLNLPEELPLSWNAYASFWQGNVLTSNEGGRTNG